MATEREERGERGRDLGKQPDPRTAREGEPPVAGGPEGANTGTGALGQQRERAEQPPVSGGPEGANTGSGDLSARRKERPER